MVPKSRFPLRKRWMVVEPSRRRTSRTATRSKPCVVMGKIRTIPSIWKTALRLVKRTVYLKSLFEFLSDFLPIDQFISIRADLPLDTVEVSILLVSRMHTAYVS